MASRNETAAKSTKLVKSESSAIVSVSGDSVKIYQKFKNRTRGKSNSTARNLIARKKKTASSKRTLDSDDDADIGDDSDADYVHSRSLLRRNIAEFGDERMSDGTAPEKTGSFDAMEDELESGIVMVQEHGKQLSRFTDKPTTIATKEAGKVQMDLFEKEWPNVQPFIECPKPECREVGSFTKAGTARCGQIIKCSKHHEWETREQVTKLLELYAPEPEAPTTASPAGNQESESIAPFVDCLLSTVSSMKETIVALRHENTAMKVEIRRLRNSQGINQHSSTETPELNTADTLNVEFSSLTKAIPAPINRTATFAMAVKRNLQVTRLNDSDKDKMTTLREQVRSYQPKLRTSGVIPIYFRVSRGPIGALRRSLDTVLSR